jgi:hypothetical protein
LSPSPTPQRETPPVDWGLLERRFPEDMDVSNWKEFRSHLPEDLRYIEFKPSIEGSKASPTWTFRPPSDVVTTEIPLQIKGYPVVIPVPAYPIGRIESSPPPDPLTSPIDPSIELDNETVKLIFETYDFAMGFYLLLDGSLQIIVSSDEVFNPESKLVVFSSPFLRYGGTLIANVRLQVAHSQRPNYFGGLEVSYVPPHMTQTSGRKEKTSFRNLFKRLGKGQNSLETTPPTVLPKSNSALASRTTSSESSIRLPSLETHHEVEARFKRTGIFTQDRKAANQHPYLGKVALRVELGGVQYLTISTHILNNAFRMKTIIGKARRSGASKQQLRDEISIFYQKKNVSVLSRLIEKRC